MTPDDFTIEERMLPVGDGHELYVQLWGNKDAAETIVFLHGGPGSGCNDGHKGLFDPKVQRVIFFDQRGSGHSTPHGSLRANNTDKLVEDITTIADAFGVERFAITGGSWGSCLALVYAIRNPKRVTRMVLRGIFAGRKSEIDFIDKGKFRAFFPDAWEAYAASTPPAFRGDPTAYHIPRVLGDDAKAAKQSAWAYNELQAALLRLDDRTTPEPYEAFDPANIRIECHFTAHDCFLPENYVFGNAHKLTMPIALVQGRYDAVCPPVTAYELAQKLPNARLHFTIAGHAGNERANVDLVRALLLA